MNTGFDTIGLQNVYQFFSFLIVFKINLCFQEFEPLLENIIRIKSFTYSICHIFMAKKHGANRVSEVFDAVDGLYFQV